MSDSKGAAIRKEIIGSLSRVQLYDVSEAGELAIEVEADKILAILVQEVERELEDLLSTINTFQEYADPPNQTLKVVNTEIFKRLERLG